MAGTGDAIADALFGSVLARPAVYTPPDGGAPTDCRAIPAAVPADVGYGDTVLRSGLLAFKLRTADVPAVVDGATLTVDGVAHTVVGAPASALGGRVWVATVRTG